jgi:hypothetical protein
MRPAYGIVVLLCGLCLTSVHGQTLRTSVVSGGATSGSSGGLVLRATLGQTLIGTTASMARAGQGFWYTATGSVGPSAAEEARQLPATFSIGQVAPSPLSASAELPFTFRESGSLSYRLFDATGRVLLSRTVGDFTPGTARVSIDASALRNGTYYLVAQFNRSVQSVALVVVK